MKNEDQIDIQYIGQRLLERGFKTFFLFFFKQLEKNDFIIDKIHDDLFNNFQEIYNQQKNREVINIPPRAGKTSMCIYFIAFCYANNRKCNFIYTSFSQDLLAENSRLLSNILENDIYKTMYIFSYSLEETEEKPIDDFWEEYLKKETGKNKYTSRKITIANGGIVLFASIGSGITGFGAGVRNSKNFSGCLIIDDPNKPIEVHSEKMRSKVLKYFEETLLSRLNGSNVAIVLIQQRLYIDDLSGLLIAKYNFNVLKKPLINEDGSCNLESQYNAKRIEELKVNNYLFSSQYQQEPTKQGGNIIKSEWFKRYELLPKFKQVYIVCDTALKTKEANDYSVLSCWGKTEYSQNSEYYLIDLLRGKWEAPELLNRLLNFYQKHKEQNKCSCVYVEDKASGTGLLQQLKQHRTPIKGIIPSKDKYTRLSDVLPIIASGYCYLPFIATWLNDFLAECEEFTADMSHKHDDQVDIMSMALSNEIGFNTMKAMI